MHQKMAIPTIVSWIFAVLVCTIGVMNLILIHPVPGMIGLFLSIIFIPPVNEFLFRKFGFRIPFVVKIILALFIFWFTLGISDLGDLLD